MNKTTLVIEFDPSTGNVQIGGCDLNNRMFIYGLLEITKEIVMRQALAQGESRIVVPQLVPPGSLKS